MNNRSKIFHIIIEEFDKLNNKHIGESDIHNYLDVNRERILFYAFILHDEDIDELGNKKRKHYHLVMSIRDSLSKNTIIKDVSDYLMINRNCVSCLACIDFPKMVQYLTHKNDKDKYQYLIFDIHTSDYEELLSIYDKGVSVYDVDINMLKNLVYQCSDLTTIYLRLGLKQAKLYRSIIIDMWKEKNIGSLL